MGFGELFEAKFVSGLVENLFGDGPIGNGLPLEFGEGAVAISL